MGKVYPRATLRKNLKEHMRPDGMLGRSVDILIYLDYILFLEDLLKQASIEGRRLDGSKTLKRSYIEEASKHALKRFRG